MVEGYPILQTYNVLLMTINVSLTIIVMLAACLCCKKKVPKNDLLGLEGMVKLKNPDEVVVVASVNKNEEPQTDLNASTVSNADSEKRASTAAHRSLPDIPAADGDNCSELYETVADKRQTNAECSQNKSPIASLKKQTSISQHSSISQADDVSSPYSRVKNSPHDYAKVRSTEHPYAQLNTPSTSQTAVCAGANNTQQTLNNETSNRNSHHSNSSQNLNDSAPQAEIPAASAIAGMISASQDLPYMTPPINNQHFSGDSQDSSKGYTSISVREPLANILAQQPVKTSQRNPVLSRDVSDSHYATVSDDSDETYAAIEDPSGRNITNTATDIYTSGSETYAQIQPMQSNAIIVAVEINNISSITANNSMIFENHINAVTIHHPVSNHNRPTSEHIVPMPVPVDSLRAQMHSRQASSSSNNSSSMGNLSSPKPEKRQANSPLPPTPKSNASILAQSGRNSVISVAETGVGVANVSDANDATNTANFIVATNETSPQKKNKNLSPSKDIEGMYAKVMKKNKFSRNISSSQNNSPVLTRKYNEDKTVLGVSPLEVASDEVQLKLNLAAASSSDNNSNSNAQKNRTRSNSYNAKNHGYETIPFDNMRKVTSIGGVVENRKSDCYANILQHERQLEGGHSANNLMKLKSDKLNLKSDAAERIYGSDKHYETIANPAKSRNNSDAGYETLSNKHKNLSSIDNDKKSSDFDPNYEVLKGPAAGLSDDGYAKVIEKKRLNIEEDSTDGYTKVKGEDADGYSKVKGEDADGYSKVKGEDIEDVCNAGYSTISESKIATDTIINHNYASILETKGLKASEDATDNISDHYARILEARVPTAPELSLSAISTPTKLVDDGIVTPQLIERPITSPSSMNSSYLLNNSSTTSSMNVTTSTSSRQTPSSSQYESLTGSDTDPNYESVSYMQTNSRELPYERLQTDTHLSSSPLTPEGERSNSSAATTTTTTTNTATEITTILKLYGQQKLSTNDTKSTNATSDTTSATTTTTTLVTEVIVDDYFQV